MIDATPYSVVIPLDKQGPAQRLWRIDGRGRKKLVCDGKVIR